MTFRWPWHGLGAPLVRSDEQAQNTFEYLLVIGGVVVPLIIALLAFDQVVVEVVGYVCPAVDTANPLAAVGSCLGIT